MSNNVKEVNFARHNHIPTPHDTKVDRACCYCGKPRPGGKRRWCSQQCVDDFLVRKGDSTAIKRAVFARDKGICALCGSDMALLRRVMDKTVDWSGVYASSCSGQLKRILGIPGWRQRFWDADHIVPVVEGGGGCGLDNFRTLCYWCHVAETAKLARRRAEKRNPQSGLTFSEVSE